MPVILFIDEAHQMIGAGGSEGQGDAANLLKPALARGELRTIAATTWAEYKKYVRDVIPALARRFQVVKVEEPTEAVAIDMLRGMVAKLEAHHGVEILDDSGTRCGQAVASLHLRPPVARQGDQRARHRLRARGDRPERHAAAIEAHGTRRASTLRDELRAPQAAKRRRAPIARHAIATLDAEHAAQARARARTRQAR